MAIFVGDNTYKRQSRDFLQHCALKYNALIIFANGYSESLLEITMALELGKFI